MAQSHEIGAEVQKRWESLVYQSPIITDLELTDARIFKIVKGAFLTGYITGKASEYDIDIDGIWEFLENNDG